MSIGHDAKGNLTSDGATTFTYDSENKLVSASGATNASLSYDPLGRLHSVTSGGTTTRFVYDGLEAIVEYDASGTVLRRFAHGPGVDEPLVWYEGSTVAQNPRHLFADERGSIVAVSDSSGSVIGINKYDEYGNPQNGAITGRFGYTGQVWLPEVELYDHGFRMRKPDLDRFMQLDPIHPADGPNGYVYVKGDPVNHFDPTGLSCSEFPGGWYAFRDDNREHMIMVRKWWRLASAQMEHRPRVPYRSAYPVETAAGDLEEEEEVMADLISPRGQGKLVLRLHSLEMP